MLRSLVIIGVLFSVASCKTSVKNDGSDVQGMGDKAGNSSATLYKQILSCSDKTSGWTFETTSTGDATLKLSAHEKVDMTCQAAATKPGPLAMGNTKLALCTDKDKKPKYSVDLSVSSGITVSYQALVRKFDALAPISMYCVPKANPTGSAHTCPASSSINCYPPTTDPDCKPTRRQWIEANCPNVSFLD